MERRRLRDLAVTYSTGMGLAQKKHCLNAKSMEKLSSQFVRGSYDEELGKCGQPLLLGSTLTFVVLQAEKQRNEEADEEEDSTSEDEKVKEDRQKNMDDEEDIFI